MHTKDEQSRLEGEEFMKKAQEMEKDYPYWNERRLQVFLPEPTIIQPDGEFRGRLIPDR